MAGADQSPRVGDTIPCPTNGDLLPAGSMCLLGENETATLVQLGEVRPPCERVQVPAGAVPSSCRVHSSTADEPGGFAWVSFEDPSRADPVCVLTYPGGRQYGPAPCPGASS